MNSNWKAKVSAGTTFGFVLVGGILHQATAGRERAAALRLDETTTVRVASLNPSIEPGRKGNTYYFLESRAVEVISRYDDGIQLTAQRGSDGALRVRASISGEDGAPQLIVSNGLRYRVNTGEWVEAAVPPEVRPTLEWANRQAYGLLKEGTSNLVWSEGFMRAGSGNLQPRVLEVRWADGLSVKVNRREHVLDQGPERRVFSGRALSASMTRFGSDVGVADWYPDMQVFRWAIPGLRVAGSVESRHLHRYGGWPFAPDAEWVSLQLLAFHHFQSLIEANGFVARQLRNRQVQPTVASRLMQVLIPGVSANEPGCDNLHWLDGTIYRLCCDQHDRCYEKDGCTARSWWEVWSSWRCDACNVQAIYCFATGPCYYMGGINCI